MLDLVRKPEDRFFWVAVNTTQDLFEMRGVITIIFMPPTSKKLRGHIGLGLSVQSVCQSVCDA